MAQFPHPCEHDGDFAGFVDAAPLPPRPATDEAIIRRARDGLVPTWGKSLAKLLAIQVPAGLLTLTVCPQFGLGAATHHSLLHTLHASHPAALYYLSCGLIFVLFGALLSGLAADRRDLRALGPGRYACFAGYSLGAYLILMLLGTEAFIAASLFWVIGAAAGCAAGFALGHRLKTATAGV